MMRSRLATRTLVLAALLFVVAACAGIPPLPKPVPPDGLHPNAPAQAAPTAAPDPAKVDELQQHRQRWASLGIGDYSMTVMYGCQCPVAGKPIDVTVRGGRLVAASIGGETLPIDQLAEFPATIEALFDYADRNTSAGKVEFAWDPKYSIPTAVGVDPDLTARDDEIRIAILEFKAD